MRFSILLTALLSACATTPVAGPPVECRNDALPRFVGQTANTETGAEMLAVSGAKVLRWVAPGQMVTMDFRSDRLTVQLDAANRIISARCG